MLLIEFIIGVRSYTTHEVHVVDHMLHPIVNLLVSGVALNTLATQFVI